ncbi:MAG: hypothetical protein CMJ64_13380 [Planctomycetaceae bacterium]|nr:hypothetical protein [Planctomycetaceae bacterium]
MSNDPMYDDWINQRRAIDSPDGLADCVMATVQETEVRRKQSLLLRLAQRIEESRLARWTACMAAFLVGSSPFLYLAYVAQLLVF